MRLSQRVAIALLAATHPLTACTRTSGYPPASCPAAADMAIAHINDFAHLTRQSVPDVVAIENPRETMVKTGGGRYPLQRFCKGEGRLSDGTTAPVLWVISEKQQGWLEGFGFNACVVGRADYCTEE
ncbi:MAG: hypothetical protein HXY22_01855 [Alphaproteobacteria bacterium]|nr:hypothetical protein [Alphaproteobacteria bacterium]